MGVEGKRGGLCMWGWGGFLRRGGGGGAHRGWEGVCGEGGELNSFFCGAKIPTKLFMSRHPELRKCPWPQKGLFGGQKGIYSSDSL